MKKKIYVLAAAVAVSAMSQYPASASLLGAPLNLKAAIVRHDAQVPTSQFYAGDAFVVSVLI